MKAVLMWRLPHLAAAGLVTGGLVLLFAVLFVATLGFDVGSPRVPAGVLLFLGILSWVAFLVGLLSELILELRERDEALRQVIR